MSELDKILHTTEIKRRLRLAVVQLLVITRRVTLRIPVKADSHSLPMRAPLHILQEVDSESLGQVSATRTISTASAAVEA